MPSDEGEKIPIRQIGKDFTTNDWKDYHAILPHEEYDEAYLLRMLTDDSFPEAPEGSSLPWVPLHAWRALGQMGSLSVLEPVLSLAEGDFYQQAYNDFPRLSALIGANAVEPLIAILADRSRSDTSRTLAAKGLGEIGRSSQGETRARIVESLMNQIRQNDGSDGWVNGMAAGALVTMAERSVGPEVLKMYEEGRIQGGIRPEVLFQFFGAQRTD